MVKLRTRLLLLLCTIAAGLHASPGGGDKKTAAAGKLPVHKDSAYLQTYSIQYLAGQPAEAGYGQLQKVYSDRNGVIKVFTPGGMLSPSGGQLLFPGKLVKDVSYLPMLKKNLKSINLYKNQFVYADDKAVLSNAWAGSLYSLHTMPGVTVFAGGDDFSFLLSDGNALQYLKDSKVIWEGKSADKLQDIIFDKTRNAYWLLGQNSVALFSVSTRTISSKYSGAGFTCFTLANNNTQIIVGTNNGYITLNAETGAQQGTIANKLPSTSLTVVKEIGNHLWFGSAEGAFMLQEDGKYKYYASKRWMPSNNVIDIAAGSDGSVLVLTGKGLAEIHFAAMTLYEKAMYFEKQVRSRHIRLGFNATISGMKNGDVTTGSLEDSDNDGLWTTMYMGAEVFRYAATKSPEALQNCRESLDAIERLYTINSQKGFPSRSFERIGFEVSDVQAPPPGNPNVKPEYPGNASTQSPFDVWRHAEDPEWDWKSTTSSDEAIGHVFIFGAIAELVDDPAMKKKAIGLLDALMTHIVEHEMYMIDWNGKPTKWGRWNPEYVNARPVMVGDRKITSSNIIAMLQTAFHFTGKAMFKDKALELMSKYGYLENLTRPMKEINHAPADADELSKELSDGWNHSDDEMYFLGYWGLYRYALNDSLKKIYKEAILDHWQIERPEKEGAWNIFTAITGVKEFDLPEAVWYLQKYPLDMINWRQNNSHRKDINFIPKNFRKQTIEEVLPPDELPVERHNSNRFDLDGGDENGSYELSAGDVWLLPYWMGRYLKVISAPVEPKSTPAKQAGSAYLDAPFSQRYSIKYYFNDSTVQPLSIAADHNSTIKILTNNGLLIPRAGELLYPGSLVKDVSYLPILKKKFQRLACIKANTFMPMI